MSFAIKHGLFKLNITDHHAVLGVSLDAKPKEIRLQYLKIAQKLHPDKCRSNEARMKVAGQILSKLVNPAYEQLSRKNAFAEHQLILIQVGKRIAENKDKVTVKSSQAQELLEAGNSTELVYQKLLKKLSAEQYESLEQAEAKIGAISELNLVYLMLQDDRRINRHQTTAKPATAKTNNPETNPEKNPQKQTPAKPTPAAPANPAPIVEEPTTESRVAAFVDRAQQYISKGEFDRAIKELKDALRIDPNNGIAHAVMGRAYLHKRQLTMAKVHISKACQAEPHNLIVTDSKKALDKLTRVADKSKRSNPDGDRKSGNSSFFSGFFGAKKK